MYEPQGVSDKDIRFPKEWKLYIFCVLGTTVHPVCNLFFSVQFLLFLDCELLAYALHFL